VLNAGVWIPDAAGAELIDQRIGNGNLPFLLIFRSEGEVKLLGHGESLCGEVHVAPCGVLDLLIAGSREEKELQELRLLLVCCGQEGVDLMRLVGGDGFLGVLTGSVFSRGQPILLWLKKIFRKLELFATVRGTLPDVFRWSR
jgi:hypothetical protein